MSFSTRNDKKVAVFCSSAFQTAKKKQVMSEKAKLYVFVPSHIRENCSDSFATTDLHGSADAVTYRARGYNQSAIGLALMFTSNSCLRNLRHIFLFMQCFMCHPAETPNGCGPGHYSITLTVIQLVFGCLNAIYVDKMIGLAR